MQRKNAFYDEYVGGVDGSILGETSVFFERVDRDFRYFAGWMSVIE